MPPHRPTVSVIVPTLNEAPNLPLVFPYLPRDWIDEVILVDGRSTDGTVATARQLLPEIKVVLEPRKGKGAALRAGYRAASGEVVVVVDADGSNDPREIPRFVQALMEGSDFVKGSRFAPRGGTTDMPRYRKMGNGAFVLMVNALFDQCWTDLCYGYHAFWRYCLDYLDLADIDGFEIDTAIYLRAVQQRLKVTEVPSFEGYRFYGVGKLQTIPDGWRVLTTIFREFWRSLNTPAPALHLGFRGLAPAAAGALGGAPSLAALAAPEAVPAVAGLYRNGNGHGAALEQARLSLGSLAAVGDALAGDFGALTLLRKVLGATLEGLGAGSGSLVVLDEQGRVAVGCAVYAGEAQALREAEHGEILARGLTGWVARNRAPALVTSTRDDPRWLRRAWDDRQEEPRSALSVPLLLGERVLAVLTLVRRGRPFSEAELVALANISRLS